MSKQRSDITRSTRDLTPGPGRQIRPVAQAAEVRDVEWRMRWAGLLRAAVDDDQRSAVADDLLWAQQWTSLDDALRAAGCHPSSFQRRRHLTRAAWFSKRPVALPKSQQHAGLYHNRLPKEIFLRLRLAPAVRDSAGDVIHEAGWLVSMSPRPDQRAKTEGAQQGRADDFDDVIELAEAWALVAER